MLRKFLLMLFLFNTTVIAGEVEILAADWQKSEGNLWSLKVTLKHADTGWDHYADGWRVVDAKGNVLGDRVLRHPHVNEQPFTRGLRNVTLPQDLQFVYIEAHDKKHGWAATRLKVNLKKMTNGRLIVERP